MKKLSEFIIKSRYVIIAVFVLLAAFSVWGLFQSKINSDILSYIPSGTVTSDGKDALFHEFGIEGDLTIAISGANLTVDEVGAKVSKISDIKNVSSVTWLGSFAILEVISPENYSKVTELFNKDGDYLLLVMLDVSASDKAAGVVLDEINSILNGCDYCLGGTTAVAQEIYQAALSELPYYLIAAVILVFIILILTSHSYIEPVIFITTLGVSILINMGTNFIFGEVSIITFCAAGVLQLGLAMDYAIFLTHAYYEERAKGTVPREALKIAIPKTFSTIAASSLTTIGGFIALFLMRFTIGADMGRVLAKGILLALLTVVFLQPCLIFILNKLIDKTHKKALDFRFKGLAEGSVKHRKALIAVFLLMVIPVFIGQLSLKYNYVQFMYVDKEDTALQEYVDSFSAQTYVAVPITEGSYDSQYAYLEELEAIDGVTNVTSVFTFIPANLMNNPSYKALIKVAASNMLTEDYALFIIGDNTENVEGEDTQAILANIKQVTAARYQDQYFLTGVPQGISDFEEITPVDFKKVSVISIIIILVILILNFRSVKYPLLLVFLIEVGIWINLSISALIGSLNFASYLVISAIQLGATVDYAILLTSKYFEERKNGTSPIESAKSASLRASMSILTSATIMIAACMSVYFIASNQIVTEIAMLIARGAVISCVLVLCILPSLLAVSESGILNNRLKKVLEKHKA